VAGEHARHIYLRAPTRALFAVAGRFVVLTRFAAFRNRIYARMEEISFRTSMTVLGGVVAVAAVIAGVSVLMSQAAAPARPAALSPAPASRSAVPTSAPPAPPASPSRPAPTSSAPARTQPPAVTDPVHEATYPATDEESTPAPAASGRSPSVQRVNSAVAAWAAWWRARLSGAGGHAGGHSGFRGFGGSGGRGPGHR
jgi:hypothetical protein